MLSTVLPSASTFPSGQTRLPVANLSPSQTSPLSSSKCPLPHAAEDAGSTHTPSVTTVHVFEHVMLSTVLPSASTFPSGQTRLPSANLSPSQASPSSNSLLPHVAAGAGSTQTPSVTSMHLSEHVMLSTVLPSASTFPSGQTRFPVANNVPSQISPASNTPLLLQPVLGNRPLSSPSEHPKKHADAKKPNTQNLRFIDSFSLKKRNKRDLHNALYTVPPIRTLKPAL